MIRHAALVVLAAALAVPAAPQAKPAKAAQTVCASCIKAHVEHLAAPALNGRRCATSDEARAADYLIVEMRKAGAPGGLEGGGYLQTVPLTAITYAATPTLSVGGGAPLMLGADFWAFGLQPVEAPLVRVTDAKAAGDSVKGAAVFYDPAGAADPSASATLRKAGAVAVISVAPEALLAQWSSITSARPATTIAGEPAQPSRRAGTIVVKPQAAERLRAAATPGALLKLTATLGPPATLATHNVVGMIHGSAPDADSRAILLSAHYDHLGLRDGKLYPGANDDASGSATVLEMARVLSAGPKPKRTVIFALFGCEEEGGFGATWFDKHPALPIANLSANIEFEMVGFRDPKHPDKLMMTGYERSNLGPTLAEHGARIEQDPYPEQNFFQRSDNYALARVGVVAHTISAWPTPPTYHQPSDTVASLDYPFMTEAVGSLIGPVRWLANSDFVPAWAPGGRP